MRRKLKKIDWMVYYQDQTDTEWIAAGKLKQSVGSHGQSTGLFLNCKTTTPINEILGGDNIDLRSELGNPIPAYL